MHKYRETLWYQVLKDKELKKKYVSYVQRCEKTVHAFLSLGPFQSNMFQENGGTLSYLPIAVKDNIAVKGFRLTCGSKMLENFLCPYSATVVQKLQSEGACIVGKTNMDEFGMGSSNENSALLETCNPWDVERVAGGSSGGSAVAVATGMVPCALGSDTGGSIRQPAAFCGVYGLKPTYGYVSRYGLVSYASSLEVIGILSKKINLLKRVFHIIRGKDDMDQSSVEIPAENTTKKEIKKIGILSGELGVEKPIAKGYQKTINDFKGMGYTICDIELPLLDYAVAAYYTIAMAEASSNLSRFNGIRYGLSPDFADNQEELVKEARTKGFGPEVKLRILMGTFVLRSGFQDQYYNRAQKVRTAFRNALQKIFTDVDVILMPVFPTLPFKKGAEGLSPFMQKLADRFTLIANLAGIPAISFPTAIEENLPVGMQLIAPSFHENILFELVKEYETIFSVPDVPGYSSDWS